MSANFDISWPGYSNQSKNVLPTVNPNIVTDMRTKMKQWFHPALLCPTRRSGDSNKQEPTSIGGASFPWVEGYEGQQPSDYRAAATHVYDASGNRIISAWGGLTSVAAMPPVHLAAYDPATGADLRCGQVKQVTGRTAFRDILDGTSNTALIGETHLRQECMNHGRGYSEGYGPGACIDQAVWLYQGFGASIAGGHKPMGRGPHDNLAVPYAFGSWHPGVCPFVLADGSVRAVSNTINQEVLVYLCDRRDGVPISLP